MSKLMAREGLVDGWVEDISNRSICVRLTEGLVICEAVRDANERYYRCEPVSVDHLVIAVGGNGDATVRGDLVPSPSAWNPHGIQAA